MTGEPGAAASPGFRAGYVAIIGDPNVGKSTLMNRFLGQKISIVSPKPQTTRHKILGILSSPSSQIVFLDTPGIIAPSYLLQEVMMSAASSAMEDADVLLFMVDATSPDTGDAFHHEQTFARMKELGVPAYLAINKVDAVAKQELLPVIAFYANRFTFREIFPVSAVTGDGTGALRDALVSQLPEHPPYYPDDIVSEHQERFFVGEIIREKIFLKCQQEIPYSATVEIVEFKERESGKWYISADIYVERESQKAIVIGKRGSMLKEIGAMARKSIEDFLQHAVFLELRVRVRKEWREDGPSLERFGYRGS